MNIQIADVFVFLFFMCNWTEMIFLLLKTIVLGRDKIGG